MQKKIVAIALATLGIFVGMQNAVAGDNLFKSYAYDTPLANYTEAAGFYDCSADVGATARCIDDVDFIDQKFTASLVFSDDKLIIVSLFTPYDRDVFARAIGALAKTFGLVALTDGKSVLDLVELTGKAKSKDEYTATLTNYESVALNANELTYSFFEGVTSFKGASNVHSLMASAPANIRGADLIVTGEGDESSIIIKFSFPKLDEHKMAQQAKKPVEAF
ncbi:hypothetical protein IB254_07160 [Pseudomonas sp. PDM03]|uniref:hypothetical protein n=1 Tax=Pseudomonas TaxID=286 RepID=UPI001785D8D6|nr:MULTISPECIES: hypothetical protein [Pseudomonas]MBD9586833.1 hypothetical protein [Pseudomonas sp. PDM03]MBD9610335.1 hypothetical protein [Pseudomonas sp. PDM02]MCP1517491.1 hypothetical protein [Pseudomonas migulae]